MKLSPIQKRALKLARDYRRAERALERFKAKHYHHGANVYVDCKRFLGPAYVVTDGTCWADHVCVSLPNGNHWRYPIEHVQPA